MPAKKTQSKAKNNIQNTRKNKIIAMIILFAVIGGGIMVYTSFAATTVVKRWSAGGDLACPPPVTQPQ